MTGVQTCALPICVVPADQVAELAEGEYWPDRRGLQKITLEQIMDRFGAERIDLLKLDCEGSEFSILRNADVNRIEFAVGEYHNYDEWESLRAERLASWDYGHMSRHDALGNFHLRNTHE